MPTSALRKNLTSMGEFLRNRSIIIWILVHRAPKLKRADVGIGPYGVNDKSQFRACGGDIFIHIYSICGFTCP